ncbi:MAG: purine-nucleoside phosphorylase [Clostridia bacterium]|nr:purine-nucleoside phosphorylase [Clostridia bacterium]
MPTPHNQANIGDIAKTVIMPGDPLRAKYIAENFLEDYTLVNSIRNIYAYTGNYKGKQLTIMASGMGMPSMGIYCYELYKFYNVENIIRIGSCGGYDSNLKLFDIILSEQTYTESNFALTMNNENCHIVKSNLELNSILESTANELNIDIFKGTTACTDCFDLYMTTGSTEFLKRAPSDITIAGVEMEAFALFYTAKVLGKRASCLMSVVDLNSETHSVQASAEKRETGLNNMIKLALESAIKI